MHSYFVKCSFVVIVLSALTACSFKPEVVQPTVEIEVPVVSEPAVATAIPSRPEITELETEDLAVIERQNTVPVAPETIILPKRSNAVTALLNSADSAQQRGDLASAQQTLQRAQRIAPQDPAIYYRLASTHRGLQDYRLAEQVALKGVSIVQGQPSELRKFWLLIADIRLQAGDVVGSEKAESTASNYQN